MRTRQLAGLGMAGAALAALVWRSRPARLAAARVTAVRDGRPPMAFVTLAYGGGEPPTSVTVDVLGEDGALLGSATVDGQRRLLEIPLARLAVEYSLTATLAHRLPWGVVVREERPSQS